METKKKITILEGKYFAGFILTLLIQLVCLWIINNMLDAEALGSNVVFCISMLPFMLIGYPIFLYFISRTPKNFEIEKKSMSVKQILIAFTMAYAIMYVCNIIGVILNALLGMIVGKPMGNVVLNMVNATNPLTMFIIAVVLAPIFEELVFRKFLIDRTAGYGEKVALLISATLFALYHGNIGQGVYAFGLGAFFAMIYIKTGNVKYTIILHVMINFVGSIIAGQLLEIFDIFAFTTIASAGDVEALIAFLTENAVGFAAYMIYTMLLIVIVIVGIVMICVHHKKMKLEIKETDIPKKAIFKTVYLNWGMLLCVAFFVGMMVYVVINS